MIHGVFSFVSMPYLAYVDLIKLNLLMYYQAFCRIKETGLARGTIKSNECTPSHTLYVLGNEHKKIFSAKQNKAYEFYLDNQFRLLPQF